jgi:hypothetical protein
VNRERVRFPRDFFIYMMALTKVKKPWVFMVPCSTYERMNIRSSEMGGGVTRIRPSCGFVELGENGTWRPGSPVSKFLLVSQLGQPLETKKNRFLMAILKREIIAMITIPMLVKSVRLTVA